MDQKISLKAAEKKVFRATYNDGLWDIFLGCFLLIFVIAPYLSAYLGDFWSSVVFLPFWGVVYLIVWWLRKNVVRPRLGSVKFGPLRKTKLVKFTLVMLAFNTLMFILGVVAALSFGMISGYIIAILFGLIMVAAFSLAAFFLDFDRLYVYGLLLGISPPIGEWLFQNGYATHHGVPLTYGIIAGFMILVGLALLARLLSNYPLPAEGNTSETA